MRRSGGIAYHFATLAVLFSAAAVGLAFWGRDTHPVLLHEPEEASICAEEMMDLICSGEFEQAQEMLYGLPDLGVGRKPADPVGELIWEAYIGSLDYALMGDVYATETGLAQDVKLISLELPSVTEQLGSRARALLNESVAAAEDVSELYDENNEYREDLVTEVLQEAARQALEEDVRYSYQILSLQLVYSDNRWWVAADQAFLNAISGGIMG